MRSSQALRAIAAHREHLVRLVIQAGAIAGTTMAAVTMSTGGTAWTATTAWTASMEKAVIRATQGHVAEVAGQVPTTAAPTTAPPRG